MRYDAYWSEGPRAGEVYGKDIELQEIIAKQNLDEDEFLYAIHEFGSCEALINFNTGECIVAVPSGKPYPGPNREAKK